MSYLTKKGEISIYFDKLADGRGQDRINNV